MFEELRGELDYADSLGALECDWIEQLRDPAAAGQLDWLVDYPFAEQPCLGALDALRRVARGGPKVVLSDGDTVFQPRRSGNVPTLNAYRSGKRPSLISSDRFLRDPLKSL